MSANSPYLGTGAADDLPPAQAGSCGGSDKAATRGVARWLSLAAAPTFAFMGLVAALGDGSDRLCSAGHGASPLTGMVAMYLLMSAVHMAPWLKLVSSRRTAARRN